MPIRSHSGPDPLGRFDQIMDQAGETRPAAVYVTGGEEDEQFLAFVALRMPGVARLDFQPTGGEPQLWLFAADSWVCHNTHSGTAEQYGPRRLWDELEHLYARWETLGRPDRDRMGLTVTPDGTHRLWIDTPAAVVATL